MDDKALYDMYIEHNEGLGRKRENIDLNEKSDIVKILKSKNRTESESLDDKLLIDVEFPSGYAFSIAGRNQLKGTKEFDDMFKLSIKVCDNSNKELSPDSRIYIHREKKVDKNGKCVVRLDSPFYKNMSMTKFLKEEPHSVKTIDELYMLDHGAEFTGGVHLRMYVVDAGIDIDPENVEFNMNVDRWKV